MTPAHTVTTSILAAIIASAITTTVLDPPRAVKRWLNPPRANLGKYARAIDGDTIELNGRVVRLEAIDALELRQTCTDKDGKPWACGEQARDALAGLMLQGTVRCQLRGRDRHHRWLGFCTVGKTSLNATMVQRGWALAYTDYSTLYSADEHQAQQAGQGIWTGTFQTPWAFRHTVTGPEPPPP